MSNISKHYCFRREICKSHFADSDAIKRKKICVAIVTAGTVVTASTLVTVSTVGTVSKVVTADTASTARFLISGAGPV